MWTTADVLANLSRPQRLDPLPAPIYSGTRGEPGVMLAVESMRLHMTDETHQLQESLRCAGYELAGWNFDTFVAERPGWTQYMPNLTDVPKILDFVKPGVVVIGDRRESDGITADRSRDPRMRFERIGALKERPDVFKICVLKDAHGDPEYQRNAADEPGAHGWICYYSPDVVCHLAPYVRREHIIRIWHTVDSEAVPAYTPDGRSGCLLSGALGWAYPLRTRLAREVRHLPQTVLARHPGYHKRGPETPKYLRTLSRFKVAICTASKFGYALRRLVEATACGCAVITDLPVDEILPGGIDSNLHRVRPDAPTADVARLVRQLCLEYDAERQREFAARALSYFDWRVAGARLASDIEALRKRYPCC